MEVKNVPIDSIKPYEKNPRLNDNAIKAVAESIKEFGWQQPIVVDKNGEIIAGHTRYKAAQKLGETEIPVTTAESLTPEQVKAYRLLDNKLNELSDWDIDKLREEIASFEFDFEPFDIDFNAELKEMPDVSYMFNEPSEVPDDTPSKFQIVVTCKSAEEREQILQLLKEKGVETKVL